MVVDGTAVAGQLANQKRMGVNHIEDVDKVL